LDSFINLVYILNNNIHHNDGLEIVLYVF